MPNPPLETSSPAARQAAFEVREIGTVKSVREVIARVTGLPSCMNGQLVHFSNGAMGMVMGFTEHDVQVLMFGGKGQVRAGDEVYNRGEEFRIPVGEAYLSRVVSSLGEPLDGRGPITGDDRYPVFGEAPGVMDRQAVEKTFETGTRIIDAVIPIARGQRQLIIGDRGTGKTTLGVDAILNQQGKETICIYCCTGKPYSTLVRIVRLLESHDAMPYTVVVSAPASTSAGEQYLSPYAACSLGEYFMRRGKHVLLIFDDLTKHAWVYRQLSLLLERAPGREAYPGDIFYIHSQLVERAGHLSPEFGGGSMTHLLICDILQGDVTGFIPSNLVSMTDGQLYLSTTLFNKGVKPAIDFGLSVSRIGSKAQWPAMKELSGKLRLEYVQYQELLQMTQLRTNLSSDAEAKLKRGEAITALLIQGKNAPVPTEDQIMHLYALRRGVLDELSAAQLRRFKQEFSGIVRAALPTFAGALREHRALTPEMKKSLDEQLKKYLQRLLTEGTG